MTPPENYRGKLLRCYYDVNPYYVDLLSPDVVRQFLHLVHQRYADTLPQEILSSLRGIFTDEPQLSRNGLVWSWTLPEAYQQTYGEELLPLLPRLFLNLPGYRAVRVRFWSLIARRFTETFLKSIRQWCDEHHWDL